MVFFIELEQKNLKMDFFFLIFLITNGKMKKQRKAVKKDKIIQPQSQGPPVPPQGL